MAKIIGNTTATPNPRPDWAQTDETKADYIKNKPDIPDELADLAEDAAHRVVTDEEKADWNAKLDTAGGMVNGDLVVVGDLTVHGDTISENHETIVVEDNMVVLNSNKTDLQTDFSGLAMNKDTSFTYGAVYDPTDDTFKFGEGTLNENNEFTFNDGEGLPFAVRNDSSEFTDRHIVQWSTDGNKLIDSGKSVEDVTYDAGTGITLTGNQFNLNSAGSSIGGVKTGGDVTISSGIIMVNDDSHNHVIDNVDGLQDELDDMVKIGEHTVDNGVSYKKNVPKTAASYAEVSKIDGMTRKCKNLWSFGDQSFTGSIVVEFEQPLPAGEYTMAVECVSNDTDSELSLITFIDALGAGANAHITIKQRGTRVVGNIVLTNTVTQIRLNAGGSYSESIGDTATYSNIMLNEGSTALPYEPYFEGLRSAPVTEVESVGVNLFSPPTIGVGIDTTNGEELKADTCASTDFIRVDMSNGNNYYISGLPTDLYNFVAAYDNNKNYLGRTGAGNYTSVNLLSRLSGEVSNITAVAYIRVTIYEHSFTTGTISSVANLPLMLNKGTTALPYSPYVRNTLPIPEAVQALDGYGFGVNDTVYNYIDWKKKQFVKRAGVVDLGTLDWIKSSSSPGGFYVTNPNIPRYNDSRSVSMVCDKYNFAGARSEAPFYGSDKQLTCYLSNRTQEFYVFDTVYTDTDAATFKAAMSGVMLVYELAEPIVTDIFDFITSDNLLPVEANGTVTMVNEYDYDVPSEITFYKGQPGAVGADTFVGVLTGVASRSIADETGNNIAATYANRVVEETRYDIAYERSVPANLPTPWSKVTKIGGMSRKCRNLWDEQWESGYINLDTGNKGTDANCSRSVNFIGVEPSKDYYLYNGSWDQTRVAFYDGANKYIGYITTAQFTTPANCRYIRFYWSGTTYNDNIMLNEGTTALPYEPYYNELRETKVTEIKSIGDNLINPKWAQPNGSYGGVTFTKNTDGSITINGTATGEVFYDLIAPAVGGSYILQPNTSYYATLNHDFGDNDNKYFAVGYVVNGASTYPIWGNIGRVFTTPAEFSNLVVRVRAYAGAVFNNETIYPMIVQSNVVVPYEPYKEDVKTIPAEVQALDGYGLGVNENLYNYLEWQPEDYVKTWHKNVHKIVFTGAEDWQKSGTNGGGVRFQYAPAVEPKYTTMNDNTVCLSNQYNSVSTTNTWNNIDGVTTNEYTIEIKDSRYADVDAFKAYLAEQYAAGTPVEVVYELATPEVTDISEFLPDDNFIRVEEGGTIYAENSYHYEVPLENVYHVDINEARNKGLVVDDMKQSVTRAVYAETALSFSGTSLTIGNTTLTEAQLQKLLALLNEIEFA